MIFGVTRTRNSSLLLVYLNGNFPPSSLNSWLTILFLPGILGIVGSLHICVGDTGMYFLPYVKLLQI